MLTVIVLAAGKGSRMKSICPKPLFSVAGRPMIDYVLDAAESLKPDKIIVVTGSGGEAVMEYLKSRNILFCVQKEQKGTGDAVRAASDHLKEGCFLILCGDMPLIKPEVLKDFMEKSQGRPVSFISVETEEPKGYGRVVRGASGGVIKIVEEKDANANEQKIKEINSGVYLCSAEALKERLFIIDDDNVQKEYYLTDIVKDGAFAYKAENHKEFMGINDRIQLAAASGVLWRERAEEFMKNGVTIMDPDTFYSDHDVKINRDVVIYPNVFIEKGSIIGEGSCVFPGCRIAGSKIGDNCRIKDGSVIEDSQIGSGCSVGPMARLRPGSVLAGNNNVGNFVELKKTLIGEGSKAGHLTYLGDAEIGAGVNVGCGTITCNFDGFNKFKTVIGDEVFIGSDVQLIAPVTVGRKAVIGAGATVVKDVPEEALAIARAEQKNIEGMGSYIMERNRAKKD